MAYADVIIERIVKEVFTGSVGGKDTLCIDRVIFNEPATIILWSDNTKTIVKAHEDLFDKETGFKLCVLKRTLTKSDYRNLCEYFFFENKNGRRLLDYLFQRYVGGYDKAKRFIKEWVSC